MRDNLYGENDQKRDCCSKDFCLNHWQLTSPAEDLVLVTM